MKKLAVASLVLLAASFALPMSASAQSADDKAWINKCVNDNKGEAGGTPEVVRKYCTCMVDKMDETERLSVTAWEKKNPGARKACEKEAGWK
jgi:hypothetical protein